MTDLPQPTDKPFLVLAWPLLAIVLAVITPVAWYGYQDMLDNQAVDRAKLTLALHGELGPDSEQKIRDRMKHYREDYGYSRSEIRGVIVILP
jgi:hypothetical protein